MGTSAIENMRVQHEADILAVDGVVSVAMGLNAEGKPCLQISRSYLESGIIYICFPVTSLFKHLQFSSSCF